MAFTITIQDTSCSERFRCVDQHEWCQTIERGGPDLIALRRILLPADNPTPLTLEHLDVLERAAEQVDDDDLAWVALRARRALEERRRGSVVPWSPSIHVEPYYPR